MSAIPGRGILLFVPMLVVEPTDIRVLIVTLMRVFYVTLMRVIDVTLIRVLDFEGSCCFSHNGS